MNELLWSLPEGDEAKEWARLAQEPEVQAFLLLVRAQRERLKEHLTTEPDDAMRTWLQGQCEALQQILTLPGECETAVKRQTQEEERDFDGPREWLRTRIRQFRGV